MWQVPYIINMQKQGRAPDGGPVVVPFTALGKKLFDVSVRKSTPGGRSGGIFVSRQAFLCMMYTPYPTEIFQMADRILFIYEGGAHVWRVIWMDGRKQSETRNRDFWAIRWVTGQATLWWWTPSGRTTERGWTPPVTGMARSLHVTEKYTRPDSNTLRLEATIDDPDYYTKPWSVVTTSRWAPGQELDGIHLPGEQ